MVAATGGFETEREATAELVARVGDASMAPGRLADWLDALADDLRPRVVRRLPAKAQRALFDRVAGFARLTLVDLVAPARRDLEPVRHLGRNSLPAFRIFEKRFCRLPGSPPDAPGRLAGYNFQSMAPLVGPGYFLARDDVATGEVLVDYHVLPEQVPSDWPPVRSNERGLGRFVYGFMVDRLRRVSEHVTVGSASRHGREIGSYFVLCRMDADRG